MSKNTTEPKNFADLLVETKPDVTRSVDAPNPKELLAGATIESLSRREQVAAGILAGMCDRSVIEGPQLARARDYARASLILADALLAESASDIPRTV